MSKIAIEFLHEQNPTPLTAVPAVQIDANLTFISAVTPTNFNGIIYGKDGQLAQAGIGSGLAFVNGTLSVTGGGSGNIIQLNEAPIGVIDGVNATFVTQYDFVPGRVNLYLNGMLQKLIDDYNTTGTKTIMLNVSPGVGESILVAYERL